MRVTEFNFFEQRHCPLVQNIAKFNEYSVLSLKNIIDFLELVSFHWSTFKISRFSEKSPKTGDAIINW